jgi:protocatechuate 3,4-dioxygenase beta subunit
MFNRNRVTPTTPIKDTFARPAICPPTNNLRRKGGSPFLATGKMLIVEGYVTDLVDTPIEDVKVKLWHANHFGYYNHLVDIDDIEKHDIDFLPCGVCVTNNLGYYSFTTIMPGSYGNRAPHLHFLFEHEFFGKLETEMFFPSHPRNTNDKKYNVLNEKDKSLLTGLVRPINADDIDMGIMAVFNIRMDGMHPNKRY